MNPVRCIGVSRMFDNNQALLMSLDRRPTDDELRGLHDLLRNANAVASLLLASNDLMQFMRNNVGQGQAEIDIATSDQDKGMAFAARLGALSEALNSFR